MLGHLQRGEHPFASAWTENALGSWSGGATQSDRAVRGDKNAIQICGRFASPWMLRGRTELFSINESRGLLGMIGIINCMHWEWKNRPFGWHGQYSGHAEGRTVILDLKK
jgi:hypothetical protein